MDIFSLSMLILYTVHSASSDEEAVANIGNVQITGEQVEFQGKRVNQFLGVRYANQPARFMKPEKIYDDYSDPSTQEKATMRPIPSCPQYTEHIYPWNYNSTHQSEDCLYLNIWAPADASPSNKKPVMFWIFGGGYRYGTIENTGLYNGTALAALGDIVVVTVNFRVGSFGFYYTGVPDGTGNAGLWDMYTGLTWTNTYIEAFGGDPDQVTLAGESSGSIAVSLFSISEKTQGLYRRAIMQSGAPMFPPVFNWMIRFMGQFLGLKTGCAGLYPNVLIAPRKVTECLQKLPFDQLARQEAKIWPNVTTDFVYRLGDDLVPKNPAKMVTKKKFKATELLIGNTKDEASIAVSEALSLIKPLRAIFPLKFFIPWYGFFGDENGILDNLNNNKILSILGVKYLVGARNYIRKYFYNFLSNILLLCPDEYYAKRMADQEQNVYYYSFNHRPSNNPFAKWMGATHFSEVQFVFGRPLLKPEEYQEDEVTLSTEMIKYWTNFVKNGKPSDDWPTYSRDHRTYVSLPTSEAGKIKEEDTASGPKPLSCSYINSLESFIQFVPWFP